MAEELKCPNCGTALVLKDEVELVTPASDEPKTVAGSSATPEVPAADETPADAAPVAAPDAAPASDADNG